MPNYTWLLPNGSVLTGASITITNINYDNNGLVTCTADNEFSEPDSTNVSVMVTGPLLIQGNPTEPISKLNHTLNITCSTNTTQTWFVWKNGTQNINPSNKVVLTGSQDGRSSIMSINQFTEYDLATYTCEVHSKTHVTVTKSFSVSLSKDIYLLWDVSFPAGINQNTLTVVCPVAGGHGDLSTTWQRNNTPIPSSNALTGISTSINKDGIPELSIASLDLIHEYDTFTCVTEDSNGTEFSKSFRVIVIESELIINIVVAGPLSLK